MPDSAWFDGFACSGVHFSLVLPCFLRVGFVNYLEMKDQQQKTDFWGDMKFHKYFAQSINQISLLGYFSGYRLGILALFDIIISLESF